MNLNSGLVMSATYRKKSEKSECSCRNCIWKKEAEHHQYNMPIEKCFIGYFCVYIKAFKGYFHRQCVYAAQKNQIE